MDSRIKEELERRLKQDLGEEVTPKVMAHLAWARSAANCSCSDSSDCGGYYCNPLYPDGHAAKQAVKDAAKREVAQQIKEIVPSHVEFSPRDDYEGREYIIRVLIKFAEEIPEGIPESVNGFRVACKLVEEDWRVTVPRQYSLDQVRTIVVAAGGSFDERRRLTPPSGGKIFFFSAPKEVAQAISGLNSAFEVKVESDGYEVWYRGNS